MTDGEGTLLWWSPGYSQQRGGEVGWAKCRIEVGFFKNDSLVQTLLSLRLKEPS